MDRSLNLNSRCYHILSTVKEPTTMKGKMKISPVCSNCKTQDTPLWRKGPNNTYNCNACGLYYKMYKKNRPSRHRSAAYRNKKHTKSENVCLSGCTAPACRILDCEACSFGHASSHFFQDSCICNDFVTTNPNRPVNENKVEPRKTVSTLFDVPGRESETRAEQQKRSDSEPKDAGLKNSSEIVHMDRAFDGEDNVFVYKTGVSFHVGKYLHTSSHSAGVSQNNYLSGFDQSPNCFKVSQGSLQSYTDVCGGIEFPKIKMVPVDTFQFQNRKKRSVLNEEEMEAAEALADFAYRIRHGECG